VGIKLLNKQFVQGDGRNESFFVGCRMV